MARRFASLLAIVLSVGWCVATAGSGIASDGKFEGELVFKPLDDGRNFEVVSEFSYTDPLGVRWPVPKGTKTDGASVPRWAWSVFPPFAGKHLKAAVVHDYYCQTKTKPWEAVHRVFYDALRTAGVDWISAKTMYAAVYRFGPKWLPGGSAVRAVSTGTTPEQQKQKFEDIQGWIKRENPSIKEIEKRLRKLK